jgi:hypothetical protein
MIQNAVYAGPKANFHGFSHVTYNKGYYLPCRLNNGIKPNLLQQQDNEYPATPTTPMNSNNAHTVDCDQRT